MKKIWVTGGLGFIGAHVIERLTACGADVICIDRRNKLESYAESGLPIFDRITRSISKCIDLREPTQIPTSWDDDDILIHLGAVVDTAAADEKILQDNIDFSRSILTKAHRIVFASSGAVYGNSGHPNTVYGMTKAIGERMIRRMNPNSRAVIMRFMNVYGEDEHHKGEMASMPFKMAQAYITGRKFKLFNLTDRRDFVHVDDVASAIIAATAHISDPAASAVCKTVDVGSGEAVAFRDLHKQIKGAALSLSQISEMPKHLVGRYQSLTQAGKMSPEVSNIFDVPWYKGMAPMKLSEGIKTLL